MTERTTLIYVRVAGGEGGEGVEGEGKVKSSEEKDVPPSPACLPVAFASIVLYLLFAPWLC